MEQVPAHRVFRHGPRGPGDRQRESDENPGIMQPESPLQEPEALDVGEEDKASEECI